MPLTDVACKNAKSTGKPLKLFDAGGLFLLVSPKGGKWWRLKYRFDGKEKLLSLGTYPDVPLAGRKDKKTGLFVEGARDRRDEARKLLAQGIDPGAVRKSERAAKAAAGQNTFGPYARKWHADRLHLWKANTAALKLGRLKIDVFPTLETKPLHEVTKQDLKAVVDVIVKRGSHEVARRVRTLLKQIFAQAAEDELIARNPAAGLRESVPPPKPVHHAAITDPKLVGALMRAICGYDGEPVTRAALCLAPLVFVRPGELRAAEWAEFDLDNAEWRIPGHRMKMEGYHLVPLFRQAVAILREHEKLTGRGEAGVSRCPQQGSTDERKHPQRGTATARLYHRRDDGPRFPVDRINTIERAGLAPRRYRAPIGTYRGKQGARLLQPGRALAVAQKDDAGLGELP